MVRAHLKQTPEEKKETHKKKAPPKTPKKKSPSEIGIWPCKINGCNKQFAREADLKRHQRTTKLHSMPSFRCPQCDATFTRVFYNIYFVDHTLKAIKTDALRRHQKSRHNGIVIEPDQDMSKSGEGEAGSSNSKSRSRSRTPADSNQEKSRPTTVQPSTLSKANMAGPSSYYRQHTMNSGFAPPQPQSSMVMDAHYPSPIGLPTSATRGSWPPAPAWTPEGRPPQMGSYYQPSPYYRPTAGGVAPQSQNPNSEVSNQPHSTEEDARASVERRRSEGPSNPQSSSQGSVVDPQLSEPVRDVDMKDDTQDRAKSSSPVAAVIDPSLDTSAIALARDSLQDERAKTVSLEMTQAAMQAVLDSVNRAAGFADAVGAKLNDNKSSPPGHDKSPIKQGTQEPSEQSSSASQPPGDISEHRSESQKAAVASEVEGNGGEIDADGEPENDVAIDDVRSSLDERQLEASDQAHMQASLRPVPMEHMLTEDGEPMLNPAELLTQESLASPPPS